MDIERLREICLALPHSTEDIKWGNHLTFCIAAKMYIIIGLDQFPHNASFKTSEEEFDKLKEIDGFIPAPYLARNQWIMVEDISLLTDEQWQRYTSLAYQVVKGKLSKKLQEELK